MREDLVWLSTIRQLPFDLPHDRPSWVEVWEALRNCRPWKAWIRRACAKHLVQEQIAWETDTQHAAILDELRSAGMQLLSDLPDESDHKPYTCPHCQAGFATHHQCALHEFRVHGVIAEERYYVQSTICSGCLKDFHTTFRVTQHLRYRPNMCWDRIYQVKRPDEPVTIHLPEHLVGVCRLPAVRRHAGPLRPTSHHRERQRIRQALISLQAEGNSDFAWWEPDLATPLVRTCFEQFAECLQQWTHHPTEEAFHNDFFNLLFHFGIPEFQAARILLRGLRLTSKTYIRASTPSSTKCWNAAICRCWMISTFGTCACESDSCNSAGTDLNRENPNPTERNNSAPSRIRGVIRSPHAMRSCQVKKQNGDIGSSCRHRKLCGK